jgi:acyl-homoserine-lactone acylase
MRTSALPLLSTLLVASMLAACGSGSSPAAAGLSDELSAPSAARGEGRRCRGGDEDDDLGRDDEHGRLEACGAPRYQVTIRRTSFGIPHVRAANFTSLAYGIGYAYAQDNVCMFADKLLQVNGERARHFGPTAPAHVAVNSAVATLDSDFFYKSQFDKEALAASYEAAPSYVRDLATGYAAGYNRYLRDTGVDALPAPCKGAAWVRPITEKDLYLWWNSVATLAGNQNFIGPILAAQPPALAWRQTKARPRALAAAGKPLDLALVARALSREQAGGLGSNGWAFGRDATQNRRGVLLGNPHWSWGNMNRFYEAHLTVPGVLDVMGVTYGGMPAVVIGFTRSIAWTHTVSTGARFLVRELQLVPGDPTSYLVDGVARKMTTKTISVEVLGAGGAVETQTRTLYFSEYGPIIENSLFAWTATTAYAFQDMNLPNNRLAEQWLRIAWSRDVVELRQALAEVNGIPWVNTLAADSQGNALYADYSVKPYVTDAKLAACTTSPVARAATAAGVPTLDGWRAACNPDADPATRQPGILPPSLLPMLQRTDYVANSNNTYWLTNPAAPLTGLPVINGAAGTDLGLRPRAGLIQIADRLAGRDGLPGHRFSLPAVQAILIGAPHLPMGNRNYAAELMGDAVRGLCQGLTTVTMPNGSAVDVSGACAVLGDWDGHDNAESVGPHVFREFFAAATRVPGLWAVPFDPSDPIHTPREPNVGDPAVKLGLQQALGKAVTDLGANGIALESRWGDVHYQLVRDAKLSPAGGNSSEGILNVFQASALSPAGYPPIIHGSSYVQTVTFDHQGPVADAVLLFGQSSDPTSPYYYDQLEQLWSQRRWNRMPFTMRQIERDPALTTVRLSE